MSRIMQKEIKSEMNDFFFAKDHLDFYHEYVNVEQKYLAGIKEVRTKLEMMNFIIVLIIILFIIWNGV